MPRLGLHLTNRCQRDCDHCLRDPAQAPVDLRIEQVEWAARFAKSQFGVTHASLTGGEPTLHPDFGAVIDTLGQHAMTWDMVTNGERFEEVLGRLDEVPTRLAALQSVGISVDGATEATHDAIRGPGSFRAVMRAASVCGARGIPFGLTMTLNKRNEAELERLGLDAALLGARHVSFALMQPTGTAIDEELRLSGGRWRRVLQRVERLAAVLRITITLPEGHWREAAHPLCGPLRGETIHVDVHGRVSLCCLQSDIPTAADAPDPAVVGLLAPDSGTAMVERLTKARTDAADRLVAGWEQVQGGWSGFSCNSCLAISGKPHWTDTGTAGPSAGRERWRGAWAPATKRPGLRVLP